MSTPAPRPVVAATGNLSRLAAAKKGRQRSARRILIYGDGGLGKTTLAAGMRRPIFIDCNQGSAGMNVARYTFDDAGRTRPLNLDELLGAVADVARNGAGQFDTLVVDVLSDVEPLVFAEVVRRDGKAKSITDGNLGFNKGYEAAVDEWRRFASALEAAWLAGIDVVLLDHFDVKKEKNPQGADYGRAMPKIHPLGSKFLHTWCDFTFYVEVDTVLVPDSPDDRKAKKQFAESDGTRILHPRPAAAYMAKSRPELPDPIKLPKGGGWVTVLTSIVEARLPQLGVADADKARGMIERAAGDLGKLEELDAWIATRGNEPAQKGA